MPIQYTLPEIDHIDSLYDNLTFLKDYVHRLYNGEDTLESNSVFNEKYKNTIKRLRRTGMESRIPELKLLADKFPDLRDFHSQKKHKGLQIFAGILTLIIVSILDFLWMKTIYASLVTVVLSVWYIISETRDNKEEERIDDLFKQMMECIDQSLFFVGNLKMGNN